LGLMPPIISYNIGTISFLQSSHVISEAVVHDVLDPDTNILNQVFQLLGCCHPMG
jgi:hypothetical protein